MNTNTEMHAGSVDLTSANAKYLLLKASRVSSLTALLPSRMVAVLANWAWLKVPVCWPRTSSSNTDSVKTCNRPHKMLLHLRLLSVVMAALREQCKQGELQAFQYARQGPTQDYTETDCMA